MLPPVDIHQLRVSKSGKLICQLAELTVFPGERICVAGPNGSGKTTLLRVLAGVERDYVGECRIDVVASQRTYVHQMPYLFRGTVYENVAYGLSGRGLTSSERRTVIYDWLERLGLLNLAHTNANSLSGGERRRVAVARALVLEPKLLLLDEPFAEMDDEGVATISQILRELLAETIVILTDPNKIESVEPARTITLMKSGTISKMSASGYE